MSIFNDEHDCDECHKTKHCSLEPVIRYIRENEGEKEVINGIIGSLVNGGWMAVLAHDSLIGNKSNKEAGDFGMVLAIATGYVIGKGEVVPSDVLPDRTNNPIHAMLMRLLDTEEEENNGNGNR